MGEGQDPSILTEPDFTAVPTSQPAETNRKGHFFSGIDPKACVGQSLKQVTMGPTAHDLAHSNFLI